jgi:hypothetical protein
MKFNKILKSLLFGFAAFSITTSVFADGSSKPLCLKITPSVVGGEVASSYLLVNNDGIATGTECYLTEGTQNPTPYCVGVLGLVSGTFPNVEVSLFGNNVRTIGETTNDVQTVVGMRYNLTTKTGVGHAQSNTSSTTASYSVEEVHSSNGSVSRFACPKKLKQNKTVKIPNCDKNPC